MSLTPRDLIDAHERVSITRVLTDPHPWHISVRSGDHILRLKLTTPELLALYGQIPEAFDTDWT